MATSAGAQQLWRGVAVGMSPAEVQRLLPSARPSGPPAHGTEATDVWEAGQETLEGRPAHARLVFREGVLRSLQLSAVGLSPADTAHNVALAKTTAARFSALYGAAHVYDCGDRSFADVASYRCGWLQGDLVVRLAYMDVAGQTPMLTVSWRRVGDPDYDL